jgi:hypothetical protein
MCFGDFLLLKCEIFSLLSLSLEIFGVCCAIESYTTAWSFFVADLVEPPSHSPRVIAGHKYECPLVLARPLPMAKQE